MIGRLRNSRAKIRKKRVVRGESEKMKAESTKTEN